MGPMLRDVSRVSWLALVWQNVMGSKGALVHVGDILDMEEELTEVYENSLALGDSLNDEALFQSVKLSVGNKRVLDSYNSFNYPPTYVTELYGGKSFALVIGDLLSG